MLVVAFLFVFCVLPLIPLLLRQGYDPMGWSISLSGVGLGAVIIDSAWLRAWILWAEPETGPSLLFLPWGDIGLVLLTLGFLCLVLWCVQTAYHKEVPPMQDE